MDRCKLCGDAQGQHNSDSHPFIPDHTPGVVIRWPWMLTGIIVILVLATIVISWATLAGQ